MFLLYPTCNVELPGAVIAHRGPVQDWANLYFHLKMGTWERGVGGEREEGRGKSLMRYVLPRHFLQWCRALSCPCSCKHLVTLVYSQAARGWSVIFLPCAISGERVHLVGSQSSYSSVFLSAQEEAALWGGPFGRVNGRTRFIFVLCLFRTTQLFLSPGYHQSG